MPIYDIKTEKELSLNEIYELLGKYIEAKNWQVALYYTRLLTREILAQARTPAPV